MMEELPACGEVWHRKCCRCPAALQELQQTVRDGPKLAPTSYPCLINRKLRLYQHVLLPAALLTSRHQVGCHSFCLPGPRHVAGMQHADFTCFACLDGATQPGKHGKVVAQKSTGMAVC